MLIATLIIKDGQNGFVKHVLANHKLNILTSSDIF